VGVAGFGLFLHTSLPLNKAVYLVYKILLALDFNLKDIADLYLNVVAAVSEPSGPYSDFVVEDLEEFYKLESYLVLQKLIGHELSKQGRCWLAPCCSRSCTANNGCRL